jgi:hypothetical protein
MAAYISVLIQWNGTPERLWDALYIFALLLSLASSTKSGWISWGLLNNFLFYRVGLLASRPTPIPVDQASVLFISPRCRVATHFSRLLRHAWVTVGLFLFPGHHTGTLYFSLMLHFKTQIDISVTEARRSLIDWICKHQFSAIMPSRF